MVRRKYRLLACKMKKWKKNPLWCFKGKFHHPTPRDLIDDLISMKKFHALLDNVSAFNPSGRNLQLCKITAGLLNPQGFFKSTFSTPPRMNSVCQCSKRLSKLEFHRTWFVFRCRVVIGAPEDENVYQSRMGIKRPGAVYRCQTKAPFNCQQIPFDTSGKTRYFWWYSSHVRVCARKRRRNNCRLLSTNFSAKRVQEELSACPHDGDLLLGITS